jgi:polyadenylate-binding protein
MMMGRGRGGGAGGQFGPGRGGPQRPPAQPMMNKAMPRYTQQQPAAPAPNANGPQFNLAELSSMSPEDQKNFLGEKLYTRINQIRPQQAAKITGMLLEMEISEILNILEDNNMLNSKINEAVAVLRAHDEKK